MQKKILIFICGMLFAMGVLAQSMQEPAPLMMLKQTTTQMLTALKQNKATMKENTNVIYRIVNTILLPHVDLESMGRSVVGRTYWAQATPAQRDQFKRLFTRQVTQTYSTALQSYQNEQVKFFPMRNYNPNGRVQVQSMIVRQNGQNIALSYRLLNAGGQWKVYDFSVEGVSIVQSYSAQYANELQQGGLSALNNKLQQRFGK